MDSWPPATTMRLSPLHDGLGAQRHGAQARAAHHVDAPGGRADGKARRDGGLAGRVLALGGGQHLAQDDFADFVARDLGAFQRGLDRDLAQLVGGHGGKGAVERRPPGCGQPKR